MCVCVCVGGGGDRRGRREGRGIGGDREDKVSTIDLVLSNTMVAMETQGCPKTLQVYTTKPCTRAWNSPELSSSLHSPIAAGQVLLPKKFVRNKD